MALAVVADLVGPRSRRRAGTAALALGAEPLHAPRLWPEYHPSYYGAFVRDPDGNKLNAFLMDKVT